MNPHATTVMRVAAVQCAGLVERGGREPKDNAAMTEAAMTEAPLLTELIRQVRRDTIRMLEAAPADRLTWCPAGTHNHLLWHAGHALWLQDPFCIEPLSERSELPAGWEGLFASGSDPAAPPAPWPGREALSRNLHEQCQRMAALLDRARAGDLPATLRDRETQLRFAHALVHGVHDEARHQGEMYLLLKLIRSQGA